MQQGIYSYIGVKGSSWTYHRTDIDVLHANDSTKLTKNMKNEKYSLKINSTTQIANYIIIIYSNIAFNVYGEVIK